VTTTLLRELAAQTGLTQGRAAALIDTDKGPPAHLPGRVLDRVGTAQLELLRAARADARARVWAAGGGPDLTDPARLTLDVDATLLTAQRQARRHPDLQARLRVPSFAGLPRPPRRIRRRSPGRDPAPGQRRQQHRR